MTVTENCTIRHILSPSGLGGGQDVCVCTVFIIIIVHTKPPYMGTFFRTESSDRTLDGLKIQICILLDTKTDTTVHSISNMTVRRGVGVWYYFESWVHRVNLYSYIYPTDQETLRTIFTDYRRSELIN